MGCVLSPSHARCLLTSISVSIAAVSAGVRLWGCEGKARYVAQTMMADDWAGFNILFRRFSCSTNLAGAAIATFGSQRGGAGRRAGCGSDGGMDQAGWDDDLGIIKCEQRTSSLNSHEATKRKKDTRREFSAVTISIAP